MPILHSQMVGQVAGPDGKPMLVAPPQALLVRGPCLQVSIGVASLFSEQLLSLGQPLPAPIAGIALIGAGADCTCIDLATAASLGLPVIDVGSMASASHSATPANFYAAKIEVIGSGINIDATRAMGANLSPLGLVALVGRDVLQHCVLVYSGQTGQIALCAG